MIIQILITLFVLFAVSRTYLRNRDGSLGFGALIFWTLLWTGVLFFVWWPRLSDIVASSVGVGRGVDVLVYISIVALFYGMFRMYVKLEFIEREITSFVRAVALKEQNKREGHPNEQGDRSV